MIIEDNLGNKLDYFDKFPQNENIGISLSGGADSALLLFFFIKMVYERKDFNIKIYPIHGYDANRKAQIANDCESWVIANNIVNWMRHYFFGRPFLDDILQSPHVFSYYKDNTKIHHHKPHFEYMCKRYNIGSIAYGLTKNMENNPRENQELWNNTELKKLSENEKTWKSFPFGTVDKKFIAYQYEKYDILDLSKLTVSCVADSPSPCKKCYWCGERYWAFGNYDGGVQ